MLLLHLISHVNDLQGLDSCSVFPNFKLLLSDQYDTQQEKNLCPQRAETIKWSSTSGLSLARKSLPSIQAFTELFNRSQQTSICWEAGEKTMSLIPLIVKVTGFAQFVSLCHRF